MFSTIILAENGKKGVAVFHRMARDIDVWRWRWGRLMTGSIWAEIGPNHTIMSGRDCPFCGIAKHSPAGKLSYGTVFLSTDKVLGFLDIQPLVTSEAHVLVIPRRHYETLDQLSDDPESSAALGVALPQVANALKKILHAEAFNIVQNNGVSAGQVVDHVHFHIVIRPRGKHPDATKGSDAIAKGLLEPPPPGKNGLLHYQRSYHAQVFCRGQREDLDPEWADYLVPKLRKALGSKL
jgi:diadenosine tetraphosphate (Ap4A) HIT family hydrolase